MGDPAKQHDVTGPAERSCLYSGHIFVVDFKPSENDGLYPMLGGTYRACAPQWSDEVSPLFTPQDFQTILGFDLLDSVETTLTSYHGNEYPGIIALLRDRA